MNSLHRIFLQLNTPGRFFESPRETRRRMRRQLRRDRETRG